jgi:peptide/nickel transport system substrate-binding protein
MSYEKDPEIAKWIDNVDFRRALSLGVERDQLNEAFWLGLGTPGSGVPAEANPYNPGPEYRTLWHVYDPQKANELLDKIGLSQKDGEGFRLRSDGGGRLRIEVLTLGGQRMPYTQISEMIRQQWKRIGIDLAVSEVERSLALTRMAGNDFQMLAWANDTTEVLFGSIHVLPVTGGSFTRSPLHGLWFATNGARGKEPPPRVKEAMEMWRKAFGVPEEEQIRLGKEIWKMSVEDVWHIGIAGLSPADMGTRVVKTNMGNVPARQYNSNIVRTPGGSRPETFFWKS